VKLCFVATTRCIDLIVASELHHWVRNNLAEKASLTYQENCDVENMLYKRAKAHAEALQSFKQFICQQDYPKDMLLLLPLHEVETSWPHTLARWGYSECAWSAALQSAGKQNCNPKLPVEGVLLTFRIGEEEWSRGASWVVLLGDDVVIHCPFHYRAIYRAFLQISEDLGCPFGFGCPWFNDISFSGFPTFPIIGREHVNIFGGLMPQHRRNSFCNQDLDPYLQRLYLKFGDSPLLKDVTLTNARGGNLGAARYSQIHAVGWRDWVLDDVDAIETYLNFHSLKAVEPKIFVDVVVPSYRLNLGLLEKICSLHVPERWRTQFIIIVDNPGLLLHRVQEIGGETPLSDLDLSLMHASIQLEKYLSEKSISSEYSGNNVRVRTNRTNSGASASRNRGLDESAAEYVLFLDDDIIPEVTLLEEYDKYLGSLETREDEKLVLGMVGLVKFPRHPNLQLKHAAVLMSYLTFMFEIASNPTYQHPAWGVTANLLVKRPPGLRFDTAYAKTGGGEDVDFCLRLLQGGYLKAAPNAVVHHPFWDGSTIQLFSHFFHWAVGDSALFNRFPSLVYQSYPNAAKTLLILILPISLCTSWPASWLALLVLLVIWCDVAIDISDRKDYHHRCEVLEFAFPLEYYLRAHILANLYVIGLEIGRLWGHVSRGQFYYVTKRFDWHCGKIPASPDKFRRKELWKFTFFVLAFLICTVGQGMFGF
jgi:glycosyltransferase involved in cell wall biosynthesis